MAAMAGLALVGGACQNLPPPPGAARDPRLITNGLEIPSEGYCDQPYVVKTTDGAWLCVMTTGRAEEGNRGQHIVATRSTDRGRTWSPHVSIEPADGPEASWVMPYITPSGRVYAFYTYNSANLREVIADEGPAHGYASRRVDTLGDYAFRFSDDGGRTWSPSRYTIPVREMAIDRANPYGGKVRFFWGVGKPVPLGDGMILGFSKVGRFGEGFIAESESCFLHSDNIAMERDPDKIHWDTFPLGDRGLRSPEGPIAEEPSVTVLSDGSLFCVFRTVAGHPCQSYSRDGGRTWTTPAFMTAFPGGPQIAHPRAANFVRRLAEGPYAGRYVYWFHNHSGRSYEGRNPAWFLGGVEADSPAGRLIHWGRPEVVLYAQDRDLRMSYPDFIEDGGAFYVTETQKSIARVHLVPDWLLNRLWAE
ncbi:MAG: exo-alpha-sialidase [Lentisphaerae bacterium]|nr:exo-alpha-sialidase [Lentisphaerota bacterium]